MFCLVSLAAQAFPDTADSGDENDNAPSRANVIIVDGDAVQHTLHEVQDVDWFQFNAVKNVDYKFTIDGVGQDTDVALRLYHDPEAEYLRENDRDGAGGTEKFSWNAPETGIYYLEIRDVMATPPDCRTRMQYRLRVNRPNLPVFSGQLAGRVVNTQGASIPGTTMTSNCSGSGISDDNGNYLIHESCGQSLVKVDIQANGYQPLHCHVYVPENSTLYRDIILPANGESSSDAPFIPGDQFVEVFENGARKIKLSPYAPIPVPALSASRCLRYYFAVAFPDGSMHLITQANTLTAFDGVTLQEWVGPEGVELLNLSGRPSGSYTFYMLQMPFSITNPLANLQEGRLYTQTFYAQ